MIIKKIMDINHVIRRSIMVSLVLAYVRNIAGKYILDAGCGEGGWCRHMASVKGWNYAYKVGIDIFKPSVDLAKRHQLYDDVIVGDVRFLPIKDAAFDFILSVFVLEHLTKADGNLFLSDAKRVCRQVFILVTEHGYKSSEEAGIPRKALKENLFLRHHSGWTCQELNERSFTVHGIGVKYARKFPQPFRIILYVLFPLAYIFPRFADKIIAYKMLMKV